MLCSVIGACPVHAGPAVDIRLVKTDTATAAFIRKALDEGRFTAAEIEDRTDQLIKGGKVSELARFRQAAVTSGERYEFSKDTAEVEAADGVMLPVGITLEIEPNLGPEGLVELRFAFNRQLPVRKNRIEVDQTISGAMLKENAWEIMGTWGDASESMMLMAHFSGHDAKGARYDLSDSLREITCEGELILCDANDLKTFARATPATRVKAVAWLRERGDPVATSGLRFLAGRMSSQKDVLDWIHDTKDGWHTTPLGLEIELLGQVGPFGELVELDVNASWSPRDLPKPPEPPFAEFRHAETVPAGATLVIEAKARTEKGKVPVLFLTPHVRTFREGDAEATERINPKPGVITRTWYFVHPSFMRKLNEAGGAKANPDPGVFSPPTLEALLKAVGMPFPAGTQALFYASVCKVFLSHDSKGHAQFQAILDQHGTAIQERKTE